MRVPYFAPRSGLWVRCWEESVLDLELLRVELPRCRKGAGKRVLRRLYRGGFRTVLELPPGCVCSERYPAPVETAPLYRARAAELALGLLRRRGLAPERSVVGLRSRRWSRELERVASALAPQVRGLALRLDSPGAELRAEEYLRGEFGLPVFQGEGDLCLCFSPAEPAPDRVLLGVERPVIEGLRLGWSGGSLPEQVPRAALLTLLAQRGRISWEEILLEF